MRTLPRARHGSSGDDLAEGPSVTPACGAAAGQCLGVPALELPVNLRRPLRALVPDEGEQSPRGLALPGRGLGGNPLEHLQPHARVVQLAQPQVERLPKRRLSPAAGQAAGISDAPTCPEGRAPAPDAHPLRAGPGPRTRCASRALRLQRSHVWHGRWMVRGWGGST